MNIENPSNANDAPCEDAEEPRSQRITTPCPPSQEEHRALLSELDAALAIARRSIARVRVE